MKLWQRSQEEINNWQSVVICLFGMFVALTGIAITFIEIFIQPGTQYGLGVIAVGSGLIGAGDALATVETVKHRDK